jgi:hypothetical protein
VQDRYIGDTLRIKDVIEIEKSRGDRDASLLLKKREAVSIELIKTAPELFGVVKFFSRYEFSMAYLSLFN